MEWPASFYDLRRGEGCPMCEQGRPEETEHGTRFFAGEVSDAYLQRVHIQDPEPIDDQQFRDDLEALRA